MSVPRIKSKCVRFVYTLMLLCSLTSLGTEGNARTVTSRKTRVVVYILRENFLEDDSQCWRMQTILQFLYKRLTEKTRGDKGDEKLLCKCILRRRWNASRLTESENAMPMASVDASRPHWEKDQHVQLRLSRTNSSEKRLYKIFSQRRRQWISLANSYLGKVVLLPWYMYHDKRIRQNSFQYCSPNETDTRLVTPLRRVYLPTLGR